MCETHVSRWWSMLSDRVDLLSILRSYQKLSWLPKQHIILPLTFWFTFSNKYSIFFVRGYYQIRQVVTPSWLCEKNCEDWVWHVDVSWHRARAIPCVPFRLASNLSSAPSVKEEKTNIRIPKRIQRGPTDILDALSDTVKVGVKFSSCKSKLLDATHSQLREMIWFVILGFCRSRLPPHGRSHAASIRNQYLGVSTLSTSLSFLVWCFVTSSETNHASDDRKWRLSSYYYFIFTLSRRADRSTVSAMNRVNIFGFSVCEHVVKSVRTASGAVFYQPISALFSGEPDGPNEQGKTNASSFIAVNFCQHCAADRGLKALLASFHAENIFSHKVSFTSTVCLCSIHQASQSKSCQTKKTHCSLCANVWTCRRRKKRTKFTEISSWKVPNLLSGCADLKANFSTSCLWFTFHGLMFGTLNELCVCVCVCVCVCAYLLACTRACVCVCVCVHAPIDANSKWFIFISHGSELILVCPCICLHASVPGNADKKLSELPPPQTHTHRENFQLRYCWT